MGEEKRHQMMQNLFGDDQSEDEEEEIDSEHESNPQPGYGPEEAEQRQELEAEDEAEGEGQGEAEVESEEELHDVEPDPGESDGERDKSSREVDIGDQREESEGKETDSEEEKGEYGQRVVTSRRRDVIESGSERSEEHHYADDEDEEVDQSRSPRSSEDEKAQTQISHSAAEIRDVFGDSDDEEPEEYAVQNEAEGDLNRSPMEEEESYEKILRPEDMLRDEDAQYESDEEDIGTKPKEKPVGPPLVLEVPFRPPPAHPDKMNMIKVSNIFGIDPKPFDPTTFEEEDTFVTDESGTKKRIRLENNIARWRTVRNPDGTNSYESNARFVRWSDGSLQLLIGNEVLDISSVQDAQHDQAHLFLRHGKGILQSQGRLLKKMRFIPSSLSSNSHRLLTALVDSRHKKVYKVKNCVTNIDPEREKEEKEKALSQTIRANELLNRKRDKVSKKYTQNVDRGRQLSPGFLEEALDEDEPDYFESRRPAPRRHFEEDLEVEARAEKRIMNAKKEQKDILLKSSVKTSRRPVDFSDSEREESEYETDGEEDERSPPRRRTVEPEQEYGDEAEEDEDEEQHDEDEAKEVSGAEEEVDEEPKPKGRESGGSRNRREIESDEESPPRKATTHRRMAFVYDSDEE